MEDIFQRIICHLLLPRWASAELGLDVVEGHLATILLVDRPVDLLAIGAAIAQRVASTA